MTYCDLTFPVISSDLCRRTAKNDPNRVALTFARPAARLGQLGTVTFSHLNRCFSRSMKKSTKAERLARKDVAGLTHFALLEKDGINIRLSIMEKPVKHHLKANGLFKDLFLIE